MALEGLFNDYIRKIRKSKKLSMQQVANLTKVRKSYVHRAEGGMNVGAGFLMRFIVELEIEDEVEKELVSLWLDTHPATKTLINRMRSKSAERIMAELQPF